jgi:predicted acylesterase/phospholipase RssA
LPNVITGTSAGSLVAAFAGVRTDAELKKEITPDIYSKLTGCASLLFVYIHTYRHSCDLSWSEMFSNFRRTGATFNLDRWTEKLQWLTKGDTTFLEAYERTGRILNISATSMEEHSPPKLFNYRTAPDVVIYTAVLASSAIPGILPPIELKRKRRDGKLELHLDEGRYWRDGSLRADVPITLLHQLFRVNYTIVSQVNPHIMLFFYESKGKFYFENLMILQEARVSRRHTDREADGAEVSWPRRWNWQSNWIS